MNYEQVHALDRLMFYAQPPRALYADPQEPKPDVHVSLEVASGCDDGNTYSARLWSTSTGYRFGDTFYIRGDGKVYVYVSETDKCHEVIRVRWVYPDGTPRSYLIRLVAECHEEPLADLVPST